MLFRLCDLVLFNDKFWSFEIMLQKKNEFSDGNKSESVCNVMHTVIQIIILFIQVFIVRMCIIAARLLKLKKKIISCFK